MTRARTVALSFLVGLGATAACAGCAPVAPGRASAPESTAPAAGDREAARAAWSARLDALCTGPASIPMEIAGSREYVTVTIPGSKTPGTLRFHVDSGGNTAGLMVERSAIAPLGFTSAESLPRAIHLGDRDVPLPEGASWVVMDDADDEVRFDRSVRKGFSVGQIGAGFLSRFVVCVDPAHARLGLGDPQDFALAPASATWVPLLTMPEGENRALYPFVHLLVLDHGDFAGGYGMLLDTGATTSMIDRNKIDYQRGKHPGWGSASGAFGDADMVGGARREEVLAVPDVALGTPGDPAAYGLDERVRIDLGPARFVDRPTGTWGRMFGELKVTMGSHGAIANDVLLRYRLVLDYARGRLFVEPSGRPPDPSASSSRVGLSVRFGDDGCPEVRQVTDTNAPDTRAKVRVGDVIVAIDGQDACKMWHHEIEAALAGAPGTKKRLRVRRGGVVASAVASVGGTPEVDLEVVTAELLAPR